jgi:hypothetical protein
MMSAVMVAPVAMMAHDAVMADNARAMRGHYPAAASATDKNSAEVTPADEGAPGKSRACRNGRGSRAQYARRTSHENRNRQHRYHPSGC